MQAAPRPPIASDKPQACARAAPAGCCECCFFPKIGAFWHLGLFVSPAPDPHTAVRPGLAADGVQGSGKGGVTIVLSMHAGFAGTQRALIPGTVQVSDALGLRGAGGARVLSNREDAVLLAYNNRNECNLTV